MKMEVGRSARRMNKFCFSLLFIGCILVLGKLQVASGYKNYTVGGDLGWFDKLEAPKVDYQSWVDGKNFSLGDFLIFNTDKNHSIIQTFNHTTYLHCSNDGDDIIDWSTGPPTVDNTPVTIAVPLVKEGLNYFFSGDYDGEQCQNGQRFTITVMHGQGLPPSLVESPPTTESPSGSPDDESVPDTVVPSNFNNPKEIGGDTAKESTGGVGRTEIWVGVMVFCGILIGMFG